MFFLKGSAPPRAARSLYPQQPEFHKGKAAAAGSRFPKVARQSFASTAEAFLYLPPSASAAWAAVGLVAAIAAKPPSDAGEVTGS